MGYKPLELTGKTAVVIGGTSGIGRAIAHGLAEAGADVVATSRRLEQVKETASEIRERGRRSLEVVSDVSDRTSLSRLLTKCIEEFGKVDILVNSAGKTKRTPTIDVSEDEWNDILNTNVSGTLRACQVFQSLNGQDRSRTVSSAKSAKRAPSSDTGYGPNRCLYSPDVMNAFTIS